VRPSAGGGGRGCAGQTSRRRSIRSIARRAPSVAGA